ncbi:MAG: hypothetical protein ABIX37_00145, partial [Gammaproteobacteria bacterium]
DVTLSWGVGGTALNWSAAGQNALTVVSSTAHFTAQGGNSSTSWFNADFAAASNYGPGADDDCLAVPAGYDTLELRKYGCRLRDSAGNNVPVFHRTLPDDEGPAAAAIGTLNFTDTTLTGTLTVVATTDEPTGGDESSTGNGASAFNLRDLEDSAFGNVWYGASTAATLTVDLTGDFSAAGWEITGGTVRFSDPGFQCQQGGIGGGASGVLCVASSTLPGTFSTDGSHLSFGLDADGAGAGTAMTEVVIRDDSGNIVSNLGGVLASLTVTAGGQLATDFGEYRSGVGTASGGCLGQIRWDGDRITCGALTVGALEITGTATPLDTEPDPYAFTAVTAVPLGAVSTSNAVIIAGIAAPARITVSDGQYSIGCTATFTSAAGNIPDGTTVCVRHTSSAAPVTPTTTTLVVGGVAGTFTSTTGAPPPDDTPQPYAFVDQLDVALASTITSAAVVISGINTPASVSVTGGTWSAGCAGAFGSAPGTITDGQSVCVRHTSASSNATAVSTTLTVGGVSGTFTSTTVAAVPPDTVPDPFSFVDQAAVAVAAVITSAPVTITGLTAAATVSVAGGTYAVGCTGTFVATPGSVTSGETVCVRHTSAATALTPTATILTVGGVADTFTSTTVDAPPTDTTPAAFAFADQFDVALSTVITSAPVTITGIDAPATVTVTGGSYSVGCTGTFATAAGTISNNQTVCVRHTSAAGNSTSTSTILTVGGVSDTFTSTSVATSGGGGGSAGGGGGAIDGWLLGLLAALRALPRRLSSGGPWQAAGRLE